ncbi:MAG: efflux RND transporter periplasmic adaptor subunit [Flavobacterium sp.]|nr:efflux RND transporter periplasmic adaptor subunit [Flavobacterium sp.]
MKKLTSIIVMLFGLFACKNSDNTVKTEASKNEMEVSVTKNQLKNTKISLGILEQKPVSGIVKVNGKITLSPEGIATVSMPLGGYVTAIKVMPGMPVKKGQLLAVLEDQQYVQWQQDYLSTKQQINFASKDYNRQKELNASKAVSDKTFEISQSELAKLRITQKALEEKLRLIHINPATLSAEKISKSVAIYAPIGGLVSKVAVNLGKYVNPTDMLFEIQNNQNMYLTLNVYDKDATNLAIGQKIKAYTNNDDFVYNTSILYVNKNVNEENAVEVIARITNSTGKLIAGNYMNAEIASYNNNAFVVPNSAIVSFEGKNYVFISKNDTTFIMTEVELGTKTTNASEILNFEDFRDKKMVLTDAYTLLMVLKNKEE